MYGGRGRGNGLTACTVLTHWIVLEQLRRGARNSAVPRAACMRMGCEQFQAGCLAAQLEPRWHCTFA